MPTLPAIPTAANVLPLTLRVAKAVKPTDSPGGITDALLGARDLDVAPDVKTVITFDADYKARVVIMPSAAATDVVCIDDDAGPLTIITRTDTESETSPHEQDIQADGVGSELAAIVTALLEPQPPSRSLASLIDAIVNKAKKDGVSLEGIAFVHTTVGDGSLTAYNGADVGTLAGKLADVSQEAAEAEAAKASRW